MKMGDKIMGDKIMSDKNVDETDIKKKSNPKKVKHSLKRDLLTVVGIGQVLIVLILAVFIAIINVNKQPIDVSLKDWNSEYISFHNNVWYADETLVTVPDGEDNVFLLLGPHIDMPEGSYTVTVDYECTEDQYCYTPTNSFIKSGIGQLVRGANKASFRVEVSESVANFEVVVRYNGKGALKIKNITICGDHAKLGRLLVYILVLFAAVDIWFIFEDKIRKNKTVILSLFGIVILSSLPLFTDGIGKGHDLYFHAMRIEALADSLMHGVFPNRVSTLWFDGYGYPTSVYYGDILLYLPAIMRIIGFTVVTSYKIYILSINIGTAVFGYFCFKRMFKNKYSQLMATLVYSTATYRLVNVYIRSAVGEYTAMMFLPIIACGMYMIYTGDMTKQKEYFKSATVLALGMSGLIGCHILSTEMVCFMLAIVCVILFKKTFKPATLRALGIAVMETIMLTAYFVIPFLDYYKNVDVEINRVMEDIPYIQYQGCSIAEYFAVFRDVFSQYSVHENARLAATPGFILLLALTAGVIVLIYQKKDSKKRELAFYIAMSVISLFIASDMFPWDKLAAKTTFGRMLAQVQFPWRYVTMGIIFATLAFGLLFDKLTYKNFGAKTRYVRLGAAALVTVISIGTSMYFDGAYLDDIRFKHWVDCGDIDTWSVGAGEYLLEDYEDDLNHEVAFTDMQTVNVIERDGGRTELYCEGTDISGTVQVPVFNYKGYVVTDEDGNNYKIYDGENNTISFNLPANFKGNITVDFKEPWYWRVSEIISLAAVLILLGECVIVFLERKNSSTS